MPRTAQQPDLERQLSSMIARVENLERARPAPPARPPNPYNTDSGSWTGDVISGSSSVGGVWQTNDCRWVQYGNLVQFRFYMLWGTSGVINGSGTYAFTLPNLPQFSPVNDFGSVGFVLGPCSFRSSPTSTRYEIDSAQMQMPSGALTNWFSANVIVGTTRHSVGYSQPYSDWPTARPELLITASFMTTVLP